MNWMIYGAYGYTGRLVAEESARRGLRPVLAGRNADAVGRLANTLGMPSASFGLGEAATLRSAIRGLRLVLHCAGPFSATAQPMIEACLAERVHYLDISGEIGVFRLAHDHDQVARRADVVLLPGAGFDVVPTDCLAASLVDALPAATHLELAFNAVGGPSPGTAKTGVEGIGGGGYVRRDGRLTPVPLAWKSRTIPFPGGKRLAVTIPWGDVYTAYLSTGIPNIEVYMAMPPSSIAAIRRLRWVQPLLKLKLIQALLKRRIGNKIDGPSAEVRATSGCELWGRATSADGRTASATMITPNGYDLTVTTALGIADFLLSNDVEGGYYTPSLLMGAGYAAGLPGVQLSLKSP